MTLATGCSWRGLNSLPLPATAGYGTGSFEIQAQIPDVSGLQPNSPVQVGDVIVGSVAQVQRQRWHALVTMRLDEDVALPANTSATIGQTSLLGSLHIELAAPAGVSPTGRLVDGAVIPLSSAGAYPTTEQTLAALAMLLNGGGLGQIQDITRELGTALSGTRADDLRNLLTQIDQFIGHVNNQTDEIIDASQGLNNVAAQFAAQKPVVDQALATIPDAVAVMNAEREHLIDALHQLGRFAAIAGDAAAATKEAFVAELNDLKPVLASLGDAGPALTRSMSMLATFPFPKETLGKWMRGDYANQTQIIDLTLSRLDAAFLTGTRFEGKLTELEMQWGRTIGQFPSPYTYGNPLVVPYRTDQGS
ncbi:MULTISPECIES: MCE family protein [Mycobacteriaceae]|uniref:MCE family protein n=1 Tax=Mycobacteriaceae TaxID=1762 RepID=UPI001081F3ED|nr:MCE family protein [Mycobacterium sp. DL99]